MHRPAYCALLPTFSSLIRYRECVGRYSTGCASVTQSTETLFPRLDFTRSIPIPLGSSSRRVAVAGVRRVVVALPRNVVDTTVVVCLHRIPRWTHPTRPAHGS